ncbi:MAG: 2-dehydropantoate 2-reductase [Chloroflexi bacterium]|nr:2-dehydropantoate 2-reductase [Chloroflexota bacterium]
MKFVMVGSGAVGSYFGAMLQLSGQDVTFVARGRQFQALHECGLTVRTPQGEIGLPTLQIAADLAHIGQADYVLISVKTWQLDPILPQLTALRGSATRFLTLQNGIEAHDHVAKVVGVEQTLAGLVRGFFELDAPGIVRHVGAIPAIVYGQIDGKSTTEAETLQRLLIESGVRAEIPADLDVALWEKFVFVSALGGVTTAARSTVGEIRAYPPTWKMLQDVMREIIAVGKARGVNLDGDDMLKRWITFAQTFPNEATTSMYRDIVAGLPSELDAQTGAVVRLGREASVATPINQLIYNSLILQEQRARAAYGL